MKTHLQSFLATIFCFGILIFSISAIAQSPERWEEIGPVDFTAITNQSPTTLVMPTTDGFLYVSTDYGSTWAHRYVDDTLSLLDVHFVDSLHGMLISWIGTILFTSDGGLTWSYSNVSNHPTRSAYVSHDTAIICDDSGFIWRTTDRGSSWNAHRLSTRPLYAAYFSGPLVGFICGDSGVFAKTSDAGATWTTHDIGAGDSIYLRCMDFFNADTGIVGGFANGEFGHTFVTTDGGSTWLNRPMPSAWTVTLNAIKLMTSTSLIAAGSEDMAYSSSDLGESWNTASIGGGELINGAWYNPEHDALIIGSLGCVESSTNAGLDWKDANFCYGETREYVINFNDTLLGVDCSSEGTTVTRSTDQGDSWQTYNLLNHFPWIGLWFNNSLQGIAVSASDPEANLSTSDGGATWVNAGMTDTSGWGNFGRFASSGNTALMTYGEIGTLVSTDDGADWNRSLIPYDSSCPYANQRPWSRLSLTISSTNSKTAYALIKYEDTTIGNPSLYDYHARIFQTSNSGQSWQELKNAPVTPLCYAVYFLNSLNGFMCCDSGTIYRTTDGGENWTRSILTGNHVITTVGFQNDTLGFCGSNIAQMFRTTDGGVTWQNDSLRIGNDGTSKNVSEYFDQILFPDSNTVIATTRNGFYRRKLNESTPPEIVESGSQQVKMSLVLYPNPATNTLTIEGWVAAPGDRHSVTVLDPLGRSYEVKQTGNTLDVSALPSGVYFVSDGHSRAKFVKE